MSDTAHKNVVNLGDYGQLRRGLGKGPVSQALREARELATGKLKQNLGHMMEKVDDALFARAEKAESNMVQTQYFDAMRELRIIRKDIEEGFIDRFVSQFNQGIPRQVQSSGGLNLNWEDDDSGLGLVDKNDMEEDLAVANMVTKIRANCTQSLFALDKRIGFLLKDPDLELWQNPLGPEAVCDAFRQASACIETGLEIRLVIFKLFDQHVAGNMDILYKEVNQHLVKMGVLPEIKATLRNSGHPVGGASTARPPAPVHTGAGGEPLGTEYMSPGHAPATGATGNGASYGACPAPGQQSIHTLTFLQQGGVPSAESYPGDESLFVDPSELASGQVNVLHGIKNSALIQGLGKTGDMTIDIVAMLFDYILDDKNIPDAMRALIGRLQIPVLKVALLDREFFSRKSHPTRQLLNRLAATAVGWSEQQGDQDPLYRKVSFIVQTILNDFEEDTSLFEVLLEDLETFLHDEEVQAEKQAERSAQVMEGQERLEVAKSTTLEEIEPRVSDRQSLEFVREFVTTHWKNLLFITCARQGKDSDAWKQAVATMDELIWSVKPKRNSEERHRLVSVQPGLLQKLREGMERLAIPSTERDDFIAKLVRAHGRTAVNPGDLQEEPEAEKRDSGGRDAEPADQEIIAGQEELPDKAGAVSRSDTNGGGETTDRYTETARSLKPGDWLEFRGDDGTMKRAKLSWVSPITNTCLFTDRQGLKAGNYGIEELAELLRDSHARILNAAPLMDRAVTTVLKEYNNH